MSIRDSQVVEPEVIEIRKYSNRRLYDTSASRYVTLTNVEQMIRQGNEIRVVDAQTGDDLTRSVMLQIICESKSQQELLPVSFLRQIIQASGKTVRSSIQDFLSLGLQAQKDLHHQVAQWMRAGVSMNPLMSTLSSMFTNLAHQQSSQSQPTEPITPSPEVGSPTDSPTENGASPQNGQSTAKAEPASDVEDEIKALRHQLASLQNQIDKLGEK